MLLNPWNNFLLDRKGVVKVNRKCVEVFDRIMNAGARLSSINYDRKTISYYHDRIMCAKTHPVVTQKAEALSWRLNGEDSILCVT